MLRKSSLKKQTVLKFLIFRYHLTFLLQLKGTCVKLIVSAFFGNKFFVATPFDDMPVVKYHDYIWILHCGKPVCNHKHSSACCLLYTSCIINFKFIESHIRFKGADISKQKNSPFTFYKLYFNRIHAYCQQVIFSICCNTDKTRCKGTVSIPVFLLCRYPVSYTHLDVYKRQPFT